MLTHGSLFSGFDAPSLAASYVGWKNLFHCEINEFCNSILKYWFPESEHYGDITKTDFRKWRGKVDVLTGGFPCQPFSIAGKRQGTADNRYLWKEMLRAIQEIRPTWVVGENVAGILTMVQPGEEVEMASQASLFGEDYRKRVLFREQFIVETICQDLEREGYSVQPVVIPACAVGAPHRRDRVWFIAYCSDTRLGSVQREREREWFRSDIERTGEKRIAPYTDGNRCNGRRHNREERSIPYDWERHSEENQSERDKRKCGTCQNGAVTPYAQCQRSRQVQQEVQSGQPDGDSSDGNGDKWNVTNAYSQKLQEWIKTGRWANKAKDRTGLDYGAERLGGLWTTAYSGIEGLQRSCFNREYKEKGEESGNQQFIRSLCPDWQDFPTQSPICRGNDGIPFNVDFLTIPFTTWRIESVRGFGNAIVPAVILEIYKIIDELSGS